MSGNSESRPRFPSVINLRCPDDLPGFIETAAQRQFTTPGEYIRRSVVERLRADGVLQGAA